MTSTIWPILGSIQVELSDFVEFWGQLYSAFEESIYAENIGLPLTIERVLKLFEWKNGKKLSASHRRTVARLFAETRIKQDAKPTVVQAILTKSGRKVWKIFWLHLQHPDIYPIYDQHVHRAMAFLQKLPELKPEIATNQRLLVCDYLDRYRPFFREISVGHGHRRMDRALWSFGRFLKSPYQSIVTNSHRLSPTPQT